MVLTVEPHPLLDLNGFVAEMPRPLGELGRSPAEELLEELRFEDVPDEAALAAAVRDLLRHGGFKPSGRNKPASEYLVRAAADGSFPSINVAVDAGNAVSLHSRLPVSVVDLDRLRAPLRIAIAPDGTTYPFNPSGQVFDAAGLICGFDAEGVCATPVKDAQRSKTSATTTSVLCIVWGVTAYAAHSARVAADYRALMERLGATVTAIPGTTRPA